MQSLDVISVNIWQMLASLANLVLLFLMVKKFLYKPVMKMLQERQNTIDKDYDAAAEAKEQALSDKIKYEEKLQTAKDEADSVIKNAVGIATEREKEILAQAKTKAEIIDDLRECEIELAKAEHKVRILTDALMEICAGVPCDKWVFDVANAALTRIKNVRSI